MLNPLYPPVVDALILALEKAYPSSRIPSREKLAQSLSRPPNITLGHVAFACFSLGQELGVKGAALAQSLKRHMPTEAFREVKAHGPYLNFCLKKADYYPRVTAPIVSGQYFQGPFVAKEDNPKTMIEYSQPNTHKILHVGHMRNLCLGNALVRMHRYLGRDVLAVTYPGDAGAHVAKCLWYLKHHNRAPRPERHLGAWLGELYALAWEKLEGEKDGPRGEENARALTAILKELHDGKGEFFDLWKETRQWSLDLMREAYDWAQVDFDHWFFESEMDAPSLTLAQELLDQGKLREDAGAVGMDLKEEGLGFCLLIKSDGSGLYATKDVYLAQKKFQEFGIEKNIYIVDNRQALHFKQVFKVLEKVGFKEAQNCHHLPYDVVELPDGAMSSRAGNIVPLMELVGAIEEKIKRDYLHRYDGLWDGGEIDRTAKMIAGGAIKYGMTRMDNRRKIVFHRDQWLSLEGETGPYLQYVCARINSLERKLSPIETSRPNVEVLSHPDEEALLVKMAEFNATVARATLDLKTAPLCSYLFELGKLFNNFYANCPIARAETEEVKGARLHLAQTVRAVLVRGLDLLGIEVPERM